jgi:Fibronectin type III domain/Right handed beta helix region
MKSTQWFAAPGLAACVAFAQIAFGQIYVSPSGNDRDPGSRSAPLRTLERARDLARGRRATMRHDLTIYLDPGVYRLQRPLVLDARDSGANGHNIIYASAVPGRWAEISGGVRVTGWKLVDRTKNLWAARAPSALANSRQLYVNGVRAQRARGRLPVHVTETATGYIADSPLMAHWRNPTGIEFVYTGGNDIWSERSEGLGAWTEPRCPVAAIDGTTITMAQPCWDNSTKRIMLPNGSRTANLVGPRSVGRQPEYIDNAFELLGTPGQWYFDTAARRIYYVPRRGQDLASADVEAPVVERLIEGRGTPAAPVENIVFSGIRFTYATWLDPSTSEGFSEIQANYRLTGARAWARQGLCGLVPDGECPFGAWTKEPGNISFSYARAIQFRDDVFAHLGAAGLDLADGAQNDAVERCVFTDISGNGIELGGVDQPLATGAAITTGDRIADNHIFNIGAEYRDGVGIVVGYAQHSAIEHNQLDHLPYAAISMGWGGWPDKIHKAGQANYSRGNEVRDNLVYDLMLVLADGGGIYTQGVTGPDLASGEKVTANVVRDQFGSGHGIYTDNGSSKITVAHNVMFDLDFDNWGSRHRDYYGGADGKDFDPLLIEDNYWQQGTPDGSDRNVVVRGNHLIGSLAQAPRAVVDAAGIEAGARRVLAVRVEEPSVPEAPSRVAALGLDRSALVTWSPPVFDGYEPVGSYIVTASDGARATISAADFLARGYVKLTGLKNGSAYTFTVSAANAVGNSVPSIPSRPVTPSDAIVPPPGPPSGVRVYMDAGGIASVHFQDPGVATKIKGGPPVTAYVVTIEPGRRKVVFTGRNVLALAGTRHATFDTIGGLEPGKAYTFRVAAEGPGGEGEAVTVTPHE